MGIINQSPEVFLFEYGKYNMLISPLYSCTFTTTSPRNYLHTHSCYEICFVRKGKGLFIEQNKRFMLEDSTVFIGRPYISHEIVLTGEEDMEISFFTLSIVINNKSAILSEEETLIKDFLDGFSLATENCKQIHAFIDMIEAYQRYGGTYAYSNIMALLAQEILAASVHSVSRVAVRYNDLLNKVVNYINENISNKITVGMLCNIANISSRGLFYLFQKEYQTTPINYINRTRMVKAQAYIKMGFTISQTADICGICDVSAFSRMFKKYIGMCPRTYSTISYK